MKCITSCSYVHMFLAADDCSEEHWMQHWQGFKLQLRVAQGQPDCRGCAESNASEFLTNQQIKLGQKLLVSHMNQRYVELQQGSAL